MVTFSEDATKSAIEWIRGQTFNNILLLAILASIGIAQWYAMTTAVPAHLQKIQDGYERINERHEAERTRTREVYDRWWDRDEQRRENKQ